MVTPMRLMAARAARYGPTRRAAMSASRAYAAKASLEPNTSFKEVTHVDSATPASTSSMIQEHSTYLLNTYARPPILFTSGSGLHLTDSSGRTYLDFSGGIAVNALGHADPGFTKVMSEQVAKLSHVSNLYWNEWAGELAKALVESTKQHGGLGIGEGKDDGAKVFFSNSGTEANEGALKFARKYGKEVGGESKTGIVCFANAFHGRSMGALSVTPNPKYQAPFAPLIPGVRVGEVNDMDPERMRGLVDESVCGVIIEPIQGEGGVDMARVEFLEMLAKRCKEVGAVLIYDEIQVGVVTSRTDGSAVSLGLGLCGLTLRILRSHSECRMQRDGRETEDRPDIVTMAKPLANGFPIGAILVRDRIAEVISVGSHGTTFGGQPLATRLGVYVLSRLNDPTFLSSMRDSASHLDSLLHRLPKLFPSLIKDHLRGRGLIRGIPFIDEKAPGELVRLARERGVLLLTAGKDAVRLVPSLTVSKEECDHAVGVIESCLSLMKEQGWGKESSS